MNTKLKLFNAKGTGTGANEEENKPAAIAVVISVLFWVFFGAGKKIKKKLK